LLKPDASAKERRWYEATHIENPETGQMVHKLTAVAMLQQQAVDSKPGALRGRYSTSERQPVVAEDSDGTGFGCEEYWELRVGYMRIMELRKLNDKRRQLRESIIANDASLASAVVLPLVKLSGNVWVTDCSKERPVLVPCSALVSGWWPRRWWPHATLRAGSKSRRRRHQRAVRNCRERRCRRRCLQRQR
jgi:hypothetical protein